MLWGKVPGTVLVVDDEALIRWSLSEGLSEAGWTVCQAASGAEARAAVVKLTGEPFVVVLDLRLPDVSDLSLLKHIRASRPDVPVIVLTAHGTSEDQAAALATGVFCFLGKPFDVSAVVAFVELAAHQA